MKITLQSDKEMKERLATRHMFGSRDKVFMFEILNVSGQFERLTTENKDTCSEQRTSKYIYFFKKGVC